ncbi:unnamed protein product [Musa textilis]
MTQGPSKQKVEPFVFLSLLHVVMFVFYTVSVFSSGDLLSCQEHFDVSCVDIRKKEEGQTHAYL